MFAPKYFTILDYKVIHKLNYTIKYCASFFLKTSIKYKAVEVLQNTNHQLQATWRKLGADQQPQMVCVHVETPSARDCDLKWKLALADVIKSVISGRRSPWHIWVEPKSNDSAL